MQEHVRNEPPHFLSLVGVIDKERANDWRIPILPMVRRRKFFEILCDRECAEDLSDTLQIWSKKGKMDVT